MANNCLTNQQVILRTYRDSGKRDFVEYFAQIIDVMRDSVEDLFLGILQAQRELVLQLQHSFALVCSEKENGRGEFVLKRL